MLKTSRKMVGLKPRPTPGSGPGSSFFSVIFFLTSLHQKRLKPCMIFLICNLKFLRFSIWEFLTHWATVLYLLNLFTSQSAPPPFPKYWKRKWYCLRLSLLWMARQQGNFNWGPDWSTSSHCVESSACTPSKSCQSDYSRIPQNTFNFVIST